MGVIGSHGHKRYSCTVRISSHSGHKIKLFLQQHEVSLSWKKNEWIDLITAAQDTTQKWDFNSSITG